MADIIFWEKPGCKGNSRQKEILLASGHQLDVRDLLSENWNEGTLAKFFGTRPVSEWFNITNPQIKSGEIGTERLAGFDVQQVHNWIGLKLESVGKRDPQNCPCVTTAGS